MIDFWHDSIDEAHCLSEWGYDLEPRYTIIGKVTKHFKEAVVLALTATAPPHLQDDLTEMLAIQIQCSKLTMNRPNISFKHLNFHDDEDKIEWLLPFLRQSGTSQRLFMSHRKRCV